MDSDFATLEAQLNSLDPVVREAALDRIGISGSPWAFDVLAAHLQDPDPDVRGTAVANLGIVADERAVPLLIKTARDEPIEDVRAEAVTSLSAYHRDDVLDYLLEEVSREKRSRRPRQEAVRQLDAYDGEQVVDALVVLLGDPDVFVRDDAAAALLRRNRPHLRDVWRRALRDQSPTVVDIASRALTALA